MALLRDTVVTVGLNAVLAMPIFALVRRVLRSALASDPFEARRRRPGEAPTGPLGLRGLEV
jgi:hypothetical protein